MNRTAQGQPSFALLLAVAWLVAAVQLLAENWAATAVSMPDPDDAMRLVEMRSWLAGQGWFDLHLARMGPPVGYDSHWSRLIDAGLGGLFLLFRHYTDFGFAERLMMTIWPPLWLIPTIGGAAAIAWRIGGRAAALVALLIAAFSLPAFQHFRPGRIDHHNVQIALAILTGTATAWCDRKRWAAVAAGALTGLALAIGLESLPFLVVCAGAMALYFVFRRDMAGSVRAYGLSLSAATAMAFVVSVGPVHWLQSACDTIAINSAAAVVFGGLVLAGTAHFWRADGVAMRMAAIGAVGAATIALYAAFEPRCLAGPYALVDPAIGPIYLSRVLEMQPVWRFIQHSASAGVATVAFPGFALLAMAVVMRRTARWRDGGTGLAAALLLMAFAVTMTAVKGYSYAMWFGLPFVAVGALDLFAWLSLRSLAAKSFVILLLTPTAVTIGATSIASALDNGRRPSAINSSERQACTRRDSYDRLAALPQGLVVANQLEWGPFILAWTPHAVLGGPYHRLAEGIVQNYRAFALPPEEAHSLLSGLHASYLVVCGTKAPVGMEERAENGTLWARVREGRPPAWLEPLAGTAGGPVVIYRIRS
jgi:hypothetical protein